MNNKKKIMGALAAFLATVALPISATAAFSANLLDNPTYSLQENGLTYVEQSLNEGGVQKLFYGEYNTTSADAEYEWVIHSIRNGTDTQLSTVDKIAKDYEQKTGRKVMLATNGDYFFNTGNNVESYVNDGIVINKGAYTYKHCIGFDNAGKVVIGRMTEVEKRLMMVIDGERIFFDINKINQEPGDNEIAIYTNPGTYNIENAVKYVFDSSSTNLTNFPVYGKYKKLIPNAMENNDPFTLRSGQFAVVAKGEHAQFFFDNIVYELEANLVEIPAGKFAGCTWVLGGYDILVDNDTVNTNCHTDNSGNAAAPRTFFGFKEDGTGFVCVVDGRQSGYSVGITVNKEAELAKALGAKYALELDGGGSSTVLIRINDTLTLRNKPSDGSMRAVSNAIMLVEKAKEAPQEPDAPADTQPSEPNNTTPVTKPTTNTQSQQGNQNNGGMNALVVAGVAVGGVLVIATAVIVVAIVTHSRKRNRDQ